ncbi:putative hydrolase [uncultured Caudovirales phage]|uniref:Putative hydrolase n=1 Tax=uncultured Caudovirales phage TaxID=2100421 RepID=A0A2H4IZP4_9CAUD|nr:putative hydrolase [uncultured Caudovirales phage]
MSKLRVLTYANGIMSHLDGRVESVTVSGDIGTCFRTCDVSLINAYNLRDRALNFSLGKELRVYFEGREVFRGVLFTQGITTDGKQTLKAYDHNVYLVKNADTVVYKNKSASTILKDLCSKYGVRIGSIDDTKYVIKSHVVRGKSLFDIVTIALTTTYKATGRKYRLTNTGGKLNLVNVKEAKRLTIVENGRNIISASYSESIEDVRTAVKLTGGDEKKPITARADDTKSKAKYGVMQHYEHMSDVKKSGNLSSLAKQMLKELSQPKREFDVEALGDNDVISGMSIAVKESMTGIQGVFYVVSDTHTFNADNTHTMSLKLSRTLDVPQMEADKV